MGHKKDRERARAGLIFRDGFLIPKDQPKKKVHRRVKPEEVMTSVEEVMGKARIPRVT